MQNEVSWYTINNIAEIDTPALVVYKNRIESNIVRALELVQEPGALRPHVKTHKISEVCALMMERGIYKFKCATIAEAEMLGMLAAADVLLAYQPVGPKAERLLQLSNRYPRTLYSCLVDNVHAAQNLSSLFSAANKQLNVFIDLNVGMNRSGIKPPGALTFFKEIQSLKGLNLIGLHAYDGHINDRQLSTRVERSDAVFNEVQTLAGEVETITRKELVIVAGGSASFATHFNRKVECSPGTFVFWDWNYMHLLPETPFDLAALVITRICSIVDEHTLTLDLGHKSVASENPLPRVHFLNVPNALPIAQSEEHMVVQVKDTSVHKVGEVWYGVPVHICPTVALYEEAQVVEDNKVTRQWKVVARDRKITI
jgi:D-serine deaminase-like pyridoxal phosphate-dependent protein